MSRRRQPWSAKKVSTLVDELLESAMREALAAHEGTRWGSGLGFYYAAQRVALKEGAYAVMDWPLYSDWADWIRETVRS